MTRRLVPLPLALWGAVLGLAAGLVVLLAVAVVLAASATPVPGAPLLLQAGSLATATLVAAGALLGSRLGAGLQQLHQGSAAGQRLGHQPREVAALAAVIDALNVRLRVVDSVADRHRQAVEVTSAGVAELVSGLVAAEEGARGQIAAELHDTVAQSLFLARMLLSRGSDPAMLARAEQYVTDAEEQVRAVMAMTRPPALQEGDLGVAVAGLRDDLWSRYALHVDIDWPSQDHPVPVATATTAYRFFQEGLQNVVKHAEVDSSRVSMEIADGQLVATVQDSGPGFELSGVRAQEGRHVGLGLLRERARLSGGAVEVHSQSGRGTTLVLRLPLPAQRSPAGVETGRPYVRGDDPLAQPA